MSDIVKSGEIVLVKKPGQLEKVTPLQFALLNAVYEEYYATKTKQDKIKAAALPLLCLIRLRQWKSKEEMEKFMKTTLETHWNEFEQFTRLNTDTNLENIYSKKVKSELGLEKEEDEE